MNKEIYRMPEVHELKRTLSVLKLERTAHRKDDQARGRANIARKNAENSRLDQVRAELNRIAPRKAA